MTLCKHCKKEKKFDISGETEEELEANRFDIIGGKAYSFKGIWKVEMGVCERFQTSDDQYKEKQGFFYCDEDRAEDCAFFEPAEE